jgi:hypothetical protein
LRALQESFWGLISARTGVQDALSEMPAHAWLAEAVVSDSFAPSVERLDVYANMYFHRLRDNLAHDFPKLTAAVGHAAFHDLAADYLSACPSREPSVRYFGQRLPASLRTHPTSEIRPWLAELAELEWARLDLFDRDDEPVLTVDDLQQAAALGFLELRLQLIAAHTLVRPRYAVDAVWRALHQGERVAEPQGSAGHGLLVWRQPDLYVYHRPLDAIEAELLSRLAEGISFVELCELLARQLSCDEAAQRAVALLSGWTQAGLLKR